MSTVSEALKELNEEVKQEDMLDDETYNKLENEYDDLKAKVDQMHDESMKAIRNKENVSKEFQDEYDKIRKRYWELQRILNAHERASNYFKGSIEPATEEEWADLLYNLPEEFEFEDLEAEIETEATDEPVGWNSNTDSIIYKDYPAKHGYVNNWTITIEPTKELVAKFLGKKVEDILSRDLVLVNEDDYMDFILNDPDCRKLAIEDAQENYDYDDVDWDDNEPDPDYYYDMYYDR